MKDMPSSNEAQLTRWVDELVLEGVDVLREEHLDIVRYNKLNNIKDIVGIYVTKLLIDNGLVASRYDKRLDTYLQHSVDIIECYKHNPFVTQQEIYNQTD